MFEFLKGKKNHFIGVDFGTSSIKVVELSYKNQKVSLENYGIINLDWENQSIGKDAFRKTSYEQKLGNSLKSLLSRMKLKSGSAYVAIPGFSGLITIIELPEMQDEELTKAIHFEAHKYIPSSLDDIAMSWEIIEHINTNLPLSLTNEKTTSDKKIKVLLVAAPKKDIELYDKFVSGSSLKVNAIELETFSLIRSLIGDDSGNFLIIDMGARATNIILVEKGIAIVNRNIDVGGNEITAAIADSMNISKQRAEIFKKGEKDILNSKETGLVIPALESVASEAKRILAAYKTKNINARIDGVLLSGGTARMKGLEEYFANLLETKAMLGNPWRRIAVQDEAKSLTAQLGGSFSVVLGLALRGLEEYKRE
jgi:type IV pilus assembly protein PilM